jgi:hypothetical protein
MNEDVIEKTVYEKKVDHLLDIFEENRNAIMQMIGDLEKLKDKLDTIFPDAPDARHMRFFEEKVKAISSFFNVLLDMRKEINKSLKDEIDIRRRSESKDTELDVENLLDVRQASRKIEDFQDATAKMKAKRVKKIKHMELPEGVEIPGVNAREEGV